jgi:cell wall-associated NlpC family hydrolase
MADELSQETGSKTKLLNDMQALLQKIAAEYDRIDAKSKSINSNLKNINGNLAGATGGGTSTSQIAAGGGTFSGGFANYMQSQGGAFGFLKNVGSTILGTASAAASALPTVQQAVSSQLLTSQAKFSGMQGNVNSTVRSLMGMGTTSSSTDVQQAIAQGTANGVLPGLPGYNSQIMPGVMQLSNLTGSAQSAMQVTSALNQGQSVNTLRMMGIAVRGANGAERNPAAIFKDIYNFAVQQSGGRLNASNIAIALQPGNGLANLLDAAASGDQALRGALQTAALQFSKGGDLSRASTTATGQTTSALNSQSNLNQAQFGLLSASQDPMAKGYTEGNNLLAGYTKEIAGYVKQNQGLVTQLAKGETLIGSQIGQAAAGIITTLIAGFGALGAGKGLVGAAKGGASLLSKAGTFLKRNAKKIITGVEIAAEETAAATTEVATLGTVGTAVEIGVNALVAKQVADAFSQHKGSAAGTGLGQGTTVSPQVASPNSSGAVNAVLSAGASLQGIPYSWGGGSISGPTTGTQQGSGTVGFDCSSFVQYVYARVGVMLPRTTYAQINCGVAIDPMQAQAGDLLFFGNPQAPHHVAIYMGGGRLIQAPQTGQVISTTTVNLRTVAAVRRVLSGKTGSALNKNILHMPHRSITSLPGHGGGAGVGVGSGLFSGLVGNTISTGTSGGIDMNSLRGYDSAGAMSGGMVSGTGLGQGAEGSSYDYSSTNMAQSYLSMNSRTGILETPTRAGGTTVHYGGVTIPITLPQGSQIDAKELASMIKKELVFININAKVATT